MAQELSKEELDKSILESQKKMKEESEFFKVERRAALIWNIIFFLGILTASIVIDLVVNKSELNIRELVKTKHFYKFPIVATLLGLILSFLTGILGAYFKNKSLKSKSDFDISEFLKESYNNRLDKSRLNPKNL